MSGRRRPVLPAHALAKPVTSQNFNILSSGTNFKHALWGFRTGFMFSKRTLQRLSQCPRAETQRGQGPLNVVSSVHSSIQGSLMLPGIPRGPHLHTRSQHCMSPPHLSLCPLLTLSCQPSTCSDYPATPNRIHQCLPSCGCRKVTLSASGLFLQASCKTSIHQSKKNLFRPHSLLSRAVLVRQDVHGRCVPLHMHKGICLSFVCSA